MQICFIMLSGMQILNLCLKDSWFTDIFNNLKGIDDLITLHEKIYFHGYSLISYGCWCDTKITNSLYSVYYYYIIALFDTG